MMFSRRPINATVPDPAQDDLLYREARLRFAGEVLLLLAVMAYLLIDFLTTAHFDIHDFRGLVHLPDDLAKAYEFAIPTRYVTSNTNEHYAVPSLVSILLVASVFGAILRRRWLITRYYLAFFVLPLPLLGIQLGVAAFLTSVILVTWTGLALARRNAVYAALSVLLLFGSWSYFSWLSDFAPTSTRPYIFIRSPNASSGTDHTGQLKPSSQIKSFAEFHGAPASPPVPQRKIRQLDKLENWEVSPDLKLALSYALVQDAAIRGDKEFVVKHLPPVKAAYSDPESYEYKRVHALISYTSDQLPKPFSLQWFLGIVGMGLMTIMLVGGIGLQTLAGKIVKRNQRIKGLRAGLAVPANVGVTPPVAQEFKPDIGNVIKDALRFRLRLTGGIAIALLLLSGCLFWLMRQAAHASGLQGERLIHIPRQALDAFPIGFTGVTSVMYDAPVTQRLSLILPYMVALLVIILLLKRHYRLFSILAVLAFIWQANLVFSPQTKGMVEIPLDAIRANTLAQMEQKAGKSTPVINGVADVSNYILAQRAHLVEDTDELSKRLQILSLSVLRKLDVVEWRYTVMTDWLSQKSGVPTPDTRHSKFLRAYRWLSNSLSSLSVSVFGLAIVFALFASGFAWRGHRLNRFIQSMHQAKASQRLKESLVTSASTR